MNQRKAIVTASAFLTCLCMPSWLSTRAAQAGQQDFESEAVFEVYHDESLPLRDIEPIPPERGPKRVVPLHRIITPEGARPTAEVASGPDPVGQTLVGPLVAGTVGLNFEGIGQGQYGFTVSSIPPDANLSVGLTQVVQWVNTSFAVFNKSTGGLVYGPAAGNTLWSGFGGPCEFNNSGDPIVSYDQFANRWVMTQPVFSSPYYQCFAISTTADATGSYYRYAYPMPYFPDYPKLGVWVPSGQWGAYFVTWNMFNGDDFIGARICAFDRHRMTAGQTAPSVCYQLPDYGDCLECGGLLPTDVDGSSQPPAGSPNPIFNLGLQHQFGRWVFYMDFSQTPPYSDLDNLAPITPAAFYETCQQNSSTRTCVAQPNTAQTLDALSFFLMYRSAYRRFGDHESIVLTHSVQGTSGQQNNYSGIRWYELRGGLNWQIYQQGTYKPDTNYGWMGSIAMDKAGDIAVGYSLSSNLNYPRICMTGRIPSDPLGTMEQEVVIKVGAGSQTGYSRWGDYDSMAVDPVDDCTFWYTNEYLPSTGNFNWRTRISTFKFTRCQ